MSKEEKPPRNQPNPRGRKSDGGYTEDGMPPNILDQNRPAPARPSIRPRPKP